MNRKTVKKMVMISAFMMGTFLFSGCKKQAQTPPLETNVSTEQPSVKATEIEPNVTQTPGVTQTPQIVTDTTEIQGMAKDIAKSMTLEEKIGQLLIVNFEQLDTRKGACYEFRKINKKMKESLENYHVGGVIFFARNIEDRDQTTTFITDLQANTKVPLFISVDEEGGDVARIANNDNMRTTKFPPMQKVGEDEDEDYAYNMGCTMGTEIKELGFNLNFAPVADVKTNVFNKEIGNRSFGSDESMVAEMVKNVVKGLQEQGVSATLKHFPGHGNTDKDSHDGAVNLENDLLRLRSVDFVPFETGIKEGVDFVMVSHISISRVTEDTTPASLSSLVMKDILRKELGFKGVIITDALDMKSITKYYTSGQAAVAAIKSGADMLLMPTDLEDAYTSLLKAVEKNEISEEQITQSVERVLRTKIKRGVILRDTPLLAHEEEDNTKVD